MRGLCGFDLAVTARCDPAVKGVIETDLCRDARMLRDQLRAVMCAPVGTLLEDIEELGLEGLCTLEALRVDAPTTKNGPPLAITAA